MEHKLIQGGEQFLPFARSRIKALRATGLRYATQRFSIDGVEIAVRLVGEHEYIEIKGGKGMPFSGITRAGLITAVDGEAVLQTFKPTQQSWDKTLKRDSAKFPRMFRDEAELAVNIHPDIAPLGAALFNDSQYEHVSASMYSGLMAKAVQIILGYGKLKGSGVQVQYDWRWRRCHGITLATDGTPWIVEISQNDGVRIRRLPISSGTTGGGPNVLTEATNVFGGLPTGAPFASGELTQLLTAADMNPFYTNSAYSSAMGWSFNADGTQAHNTCWGVSFGTRIGYHFKLGITIGARGSPPEATTATLTLVESGYLSNAGTFGFYEPDTGLFVSVPNDNVARSAYSTPIFVCHIDGVLDVVRLTHEETPAYSTSSSGQFCGPSNQNLPMQWHELISGGFVNCVQSLRYPVIYGSTETTIDYTHTVFSTAVKHRYTGSAIYKLTEVRVARSSTLVRTYRTGTSSAVWPARARDCYVFYRPGSKVQESSPATSIEMWELYDPTAYTVAFDGTDYTVTAATQPLATPINGCPVVPATSYFTTGFMLAAAFNAELATFLGGNQPTSPDPTPVLRDTVYTENLATVHIVTAPGVIIDHQPYTTEMQRLAANTTWQTTFYPLSGARFGVTYSVFGPGTEIAHSFSLYPGAGVVCTGTEIGTETSVTAFDYSFLGYL